MSALPKSAAGRQVDLLFELARTRTREGREELYQSVVDLFERENTILTPTERDLMRDILGQLTQEVEMAVRQSVARKLAENPEAPKDLVLLLANDQIEVARPVLLRSGALRNAELIEIIRHRTKEHQLAIAARDNLPEGASEALVQTGNEDVIVTLLNNHTANIAETVMDYLAEESRRVGRYQEPLLHRHDLPKAIARRMYTWVSAALRQYIVQNYDVDIDDVDDTLDRTVDELTAEKPKAPAASERLVEAVYAAGSLNEAFLIKTLRQGRVMIFEISLAALLELDRSLVRQIIYEPGWEKLAIACKAIDLSPKAFAFIRDAIAQSRDAGDVDAIANPQEFYEGLDRDSAMRLLRRWRRDQDLTAAIDEFGNL